jgi:hypothetical protein
MFTTLSLEYLPSESGLDCRHFQIGTNFAAHELLEDTGALEIRGAASLIAKRRSTHRLEMLYP